MPRIPNAFNFRVADQAVLNTSLFLNLYSPILLDELRVDDFTAPKLIVINGSPGSGKSSLLRLFETNTLIDLCKPQTKNREAVTPLQKLGVINENVPAAFGIYIHCDSSLRGIANLDANGANDKLLNTLLDVRILSSFLSSIKKLDASFQLFDGLGNLKLKPLPLETFPPPLFGLEHTFESLEATCRKIEEDFGTFLNSFPGSPLPDSIIPHSRIFSIPYLQGIREQNSELVSFLPIVMLDDLHELYMAQRKQINDAFLERSAIPRWIAVRKHVYEFEKLVFLEEAIDERDYRELNLDSASTGLFRKFVRNVANKRLALSSALQPYDVNSFEEQLDEDDLSFSLSREKLINAAPNVERDIQEYNSKVSAESHFEIKEKLSSQDLVDLETKLILLERQRNKRQRTLFESVEEDRETDGKVRDAAALFASKKYNRPYYFSFDELAAVANKNVEQFLSVASLFVEKIISRAELNRDTSLSVLDQEKLFRKGAEIYYGRIEQRFERGYAIKQLVENLGTFFKAVTFRPSAPIAPGVNGVGFEREKLRAFLETNKEDKNVIAFREILTKAVAANVLFVDEVKQGKPGSEKVVFYLNRLLCVKYELPLATGGWQAVKPELIIEMMKRTVAPQEWGKRWVQSLLEDNGL